MKKTSILFFLFIFTLCALHAQQISVSAPSHVATGENFRLAYTVNTQDVEDFRAGSVPDGLDIVAGPYRSSQSSFQITNGHTTSSSSLTYTYTLYAEKSGTYTIPPARAKVGGKTIQSNSIKITVTGSHAPANSGAPKMHEDNHQQSGVASGNELFIRVSANKARVHEQEPILLTYKVYTTQELTQLEGKMPDLKGFHTQEIPLPQQKQFHIETLNGRKYRCVTWSQYVMFPQMTGKLEIPSITYKGIVVVENRSVDPFEAYFNGGSNYTEVQKTIVAPSISIQVDPLPQKPANFSGGVGTFNISAQLENSEIKTGDALTLRVVVSGNGNLKLLKQPTVQFPTNFEKYDPKVTDKTQLTTNGVEGNMIYDFIAIPSSPGTFTIPPVELCYYDTRENAYKTVKTQPLTVTVAKGKGGGGSVADFSAKGKDIRPLKQGNTQHRSIGFYGSRSHLTAIGASILAFLLAVLVFRKQAKLNADAVRVRNKKATRVANKRLKKAAKLMSEGKPDAFYDEVLRALWAFVSYKLNMPVETLSRDNVTEKLAAQEVDEQTIAEFMGALDECEFMRYAPGDAAGNMQKTLTAARDSIVKIEETMKKATKKRKSATPLAILLMLILPFVAHATTKQQADEAYKRGNYQQAINAYQELIKQGESPELYYNLGNAYYRFNNIPKAILSYERALRLSPGDTDIRFNLQLARSKTIDKIQPKSHLFFVTWYRSLVRLLSVDGWAIFGTIMLAVSLLLLLVYLFAQRLLLRQICFYAALPTLLLCLLAHLFAWQQQQQNRHQKAGVVMSASAEAYPSPSVGKEKTQVYHEGTKVNIKDQSIKGWIEIETEDGNTGWMEARHVEEI